MPGDALYPASMGFAEMINRKNARPPYNPSSKRPIRANNFGLNNVTQFRFEAVSMALMRCQR
jgi:hypothetical protein